MANTVVPETKKENLYAPLELEEAQTLDASVDLGAQVGEISKQKLIGKESNNKILLILSKTTIFPVFNYTWQLAT